VRTDPARLLRSALVLALVVPVLLGMPRASDAQSTRFRFRHLGVEDGLSHGWVRSLHRDSRGYLWIGTLDGLNRFDGSRFVHYRHEPSDPTGLASSEIWTVYEDSRKRLWVGSEGGLYLYDRERDRLERHPLHDPGKTSTAEVVRAIAEDRSGRLWVGTMAGLCLYDTGTKAVRRFVRDPSDAGTLSSSAVMALAFDRRGRLFVGTRSGVDRWDADRDRFVNVVSQLESQEPGISVSVEAMYVDEADALWFATWGAGLFRLDPASGALRQYLPRPKGGAGIGSARVLRVAGDGRGTVYVGLENEGLGLLDTASGAFTHYRPDVADPAALSSNSVWALLLDAQGILWIGTFNGGLDYVLPLGQQFGLVRARPGELRSPHVTSIVEDHNADLWIGTDGGGLSHLDRETGRFAHYQHEGSKPDSLSSNAVLSLFEDRNQQLWIGTWAGGLMRRDGRTGRIVRYRPDPDRPGALADACIWTIIEDSHGNLLLGGQSSGVQVLDRQRKQFSPLAGRYPGTVVEGNVRVVVEDAHENLWLSRAADAASHGYDAVQFVDTKTRQVTEYRSDPASPDDPKTLAPGRVYTIFPDSRGNVWIGTAGGLSCMEAGRRAMRRYTTAHGLPVNAITAILEDRAGNLWLSTTRGLAKLEDAVSLPDRPRVLVFEEQDGLQGNEFRSGAAFRSPSGRMYFGGQRGLTHFLPDAIRRNSFVPPVVLTGLRLFQRPVVGGAPESPLRTAAGEAREIVLRPGQSDVTFEFAALNLVLPGQNQYAYTLEGFDASWSRVGSQRSATYTNLPHGDFVFRVRASNNHGLWNDQGLAIAVRVEPRWHERPALRALMLLLLGFSIFVGYGLRTRQLRARERELTRRVDERTAELHQLNEALEDRVAARTSELAAEKERLAVTLRSIGDGVIATDVAGRVVLMNRVAEELAGWTLAEARGRPFSAILPLIDRETRRQQPDPIAAVLADGRALSLPTPSLLLHRDGRESLIADSAAPIRDQEGRVVGVVLVFRDVTEKRMVEEQLQSAQKLEALGILAGGLAHDFNNLLTGIFGYIDLARRSRDEPSKAEANLDKALSVLDKARGLSGQLMTFSRAGQPATAPFDLGSLLRTSARFVLSGSSVSCEQRVPDDLWPCLGDERQIEQVVDNLLLNARQAMPAGGIVWLGAENVTVPDEVRLPVEPGRYVRVSVRDHGPGVLPELRARIFEPFFTTKPGGTGLGLTTAYSIVRKHNGCIDVESAMGAGTTFTVLLPAASALVPAERGGDAEPRPGAGRILLMDDEAYLRDVAREMLEVLGYSVETVANGDDAIRAYEEARSGGKPFRALILDLTVPGGTGGLAVVSRLRTIDPRVCAVASSGYSSDAVMSNPEAHGFTGRLTKPFTMAELAEVLAQALARCGGESSAAAGGVPASQG
jgi:PAS domain S-box-containing protein